MLKIVVAGLDGCLGSAFVGLSDFFSLAKRRIGASMPPAGDAPAGADFCTVTAGVAARPILDGAGARFDVETSFDEIAVCDAIIVPSFAPGPEGEVPDMANFGAAAAWLRRHHSRGALIGACGSGVFLLGEAGLLEGRRCTTSWWHHEDLKKRYPRADLAWGARLIDDRRVVTAAGPMSWIDVGLHVLKTLCGAEVGRLAADFTLGDMGPAKGPARAAGYSPVTVSGSADAFLTEAERIVRQADADFNAQDLARSLSTSERTLHRKLKIACGESPKSFIDRIRVETARTLLETSEKPVKELAASAGFIDEASFRRAFRRYAGMAPSAYRVWARAKAQDKAQIFSVKKSEIIPEILTTILDTCVNGITLTDPDLEDAPIVYVNKRFEEITGYEPREILGRNCRFLQGQDRDQEGLQRLRESIRSRQPVEVTLRNYRKDGVLFHNKLNITPLFDEQGTLIYFLGVQYDVTEQVRAEAEIGDLRARLKAIA
ncbi:MAG: helix-turn-helix domain-containing protein [Hyphomicrobiales bacterium]|nr:MAG: helix-turn-helix domain-containing protein [Hyphomicrobiales bacterium]